MADYDYETDPDIVAFKRKKKVTSELIPGKNPVSEIRPDLQYHDYENDPDITAIARVRNVPQTTTETPGQFEQMFRDILGKGVGAYEAGLNLGSNALMQTVGGAKGIIQSIPEAIQKGVPPQPIAERIREQFVREHPPYQPVTPEAKQYLEAIGSVAEPLKIPPFMPEFLGMPVESKPLAQGAQTAKQQLQAQFSNLVPKVRIEKAPAGLQSGGAAATTNPVLLKGNIEAALAEASPELQAHIQSHPIEAINLPALETRVLEEKHGVNLTAGQRTGDTRKYAEEHNRRGETETLTNYFKDQPVQIANAFEKSKLHHAPEITGTADISELGQHEINALASKDKMRTDAISQAYKALEDQNGGQFPIDINTLDQNIKTSLTKKLKTNHLSDSINRDLQDFYKAPTFESYEALRTNLSNEMRSNTNGNARQAAYLVRDELEKLPIFGENTGTPQAIQLKALADNARKLYAERQAIIASNPAYKAAIKEASSLDDISSQGESLNAAKFHNKFVSSATPEAIRRMKSEIPEGDIAHQAIIAGELNRVKSAATNSLTTRVKTDSFADFLKKNASNLRESLSPEAFKDVMEIGLLNSKLAKPDAGVFNYSNTYSSMLSDLAKQGLLSAAEMKLATATSGASVPIVGMGKQFIQKHSKDAFAKEATNIKSGLTNQVPTDIGTINIRGQ